MYKKIVIVLIILIVIVMGAIFITKKSEATNDDISISEITVESTSVSYSGVNITPGEEFDDEAIDEEYKYSEISSLAFEGTDSVYTYSGVEIDVAEIDGINTVYSVYFIDDSVETGEGIKINDSVESMLSIYGANYASSVENSYIYTIDNEIVSFIAENDKIISITYTLNVNE